MADECRFSLTAGFFASICAAAAVHVVGQKTHVLHTVCNFFTNDGVASHRNRCCRYVQSEVMNIGVSFSAFVKPQRS